jgi:hypothetical protein
MFKTRAALPAIALFAGLAVAHAQTTQQDPHHPDTNAPAAPATPAPAGPGAMGMGRGMGMDKMMGDHMEEMMPMMRMMRAAMMGGGMPEMGPRGGMEGLRHIEGQIAFYKAELHVTDAQAPQWNAFADTLRSGAKQLQETYKGVMQTDSLPSVPDQLTRRRQILTAELETLQSIEPVAVSLYGVLSPEQKKTADELMADHLRRM